MYIDDKGNIFDSDPILGPPVTCNCVTYPCDCDPVYSEPPPPPSLACEDGTVAIFLPDGSQVCRDPQYLGGPGAGVTPTPTPQTVRPPMHGGPEPLAPADPAATGGIMATLTGADGTTIFGFSPLLVIGAAAAVYFASKK